LTVHADRGAAMTSKPVALLLADLGVTKCHSRPHVSNDNPFSEAQFKTLKYRPAFPERFGSIQDARAPCHCFFPWYNTEHHHSGLGLLTSADVHHGLAEQRVAGRATVLAAAMQRIRNVSRLSAPAGASRGSVDQSTHHPGALARRIEGRLREGAVVGKSEGWLLSSSSTRKRGTNTWSGAPSCSSC